MSSGDQKQDHSYKYGKLYPDKGICVQLLGVDSECFDEVRGFVLGNFVDTESYKITRAAGAFLQGEDKASGWMLVELWANDEAAANLCAGSIHSIYVKHMHPSEPLQAETPDYKDKRSILVEATDRFGRSVVVEKRWHHYPDDFTYRVRVDGVDKHGECEHDDVIRALGHYLHQEKANVG